MHRIRQFFKNLALRFYRKYANDHALFNQQYNELISEVAALLEEKAEQAKFQHELLTASAVQETLLPPETHDYGQFTVSGRVIMASGCGGDWWYHCEVGDYISVWIGDVTGHGVPSALVASACRAAVGTLEQMRSTDPETSMSLLNKALFPMVKSNLYVTAICIQIHKPTGAVKIVNASHPSIMHICKTGNDQMAILDEPLNPHLGRVANHLYRGTELEMDSDDMLIMVTDGLLELQLADKPVWSTKRLLKFVRDEAESDISSMQVTAKRHEKVISLGGAKNDDISFVAIHRKRANQSSKAA